VQLNCSSVQTIGAAVVTAKAAVVELMGFGGGIVVITDGIVVELPQFISSSAPKQSTTSSQI